MAIRRANKNDIRRIIELLHQVDMVHHVIRPDLFKPNTTKYNEQELEALLGDDSKPVFVFDDGEVLGSGMTNCFRTSRRFILMTSAWMKKRVATTWEKHYTNMCAIMPSR